MRQVRHKTFSRPHATNMTGRGGLQISEELRQEAEVFLRDELGEGELISITESRDDMASSVTVWYWATE